ncbi:hypothetical protein [Streptomyces albus]|uniref:hypothetical protein n=1 Tax=Streptomyces albus TaxID=1888 RepID=UPI003F1C1892
MNTREKPSSQDAVLQDVFAAPLAQLYEAAAQSESSAALTRALELRSFLALAEEQVARVRDRVHAATAPEGDMDNLSAQALRFDAQWLEAALEARDGYRAALSELLRTMPPQQTRAVRTSQPALATTLPPAPAAPAPPRAGPPRSRRP